MLLTRHASSSVLMTLCGVVMLITLSSFTSKSRRPIAPLQERNTKQYTSGQTPVNITANVPERPPWWEDMLCKGKTAELNSQLRSIKLQQLFRDVTPDVNDDKNVFLIETGCNASPNYRFWCCIESWARTNPDKDVWYLFTSPIIDDSDGLPSRLMSQFPSIHLAGMRHLEFLFQGSPLEQFFFSKRWTSAPYPRWKTVFLSDMLRLLLMWKFGGYYSDVDRMCVKNVSDLTRNFVSFATRNMLVVDFSHFRHNNTFLSSLLRVLPLTFNRNRYLSLGPEPLSTVMRVTCHVKSLMELSERNSSICANNITMYNPKYFLPFMAKGRLYVQNGLGKIWKFHEAYLHHFFSDCSHIPILVGRDSIYEVMAKEYCPTTFNYATRRSRYF